MEENKVSYLINKFPVPLRTCFFLKKHNIDTVKQLIVLTEKDLLNMNGCGKKIAQDIMGLIFNAIVEINKKDRVQFLPDDIEHIINLHVYKLFDSYKDTITKKINKEIDNIVEEAISKKLKKIGKLLK